MRGMDLSLDRMTIALEQLHQPAQLDQDQAQIPNVKYKFKKCLQGLKAGACLALLAT